MHVFTISMSCSRMIQGDQQNSMDTLVRFCARMTAEEGLKLCDGITKLLTETLPGAIAPLSESGAKTLEALGKDKQLEIPLGSCPVMTDAEKL